ncbi:MAG: MFS transporter [Verrucomicrobiae bacterium]|nr:MFS transporter [Verrucomicrobiae bacterium]
MSKISPLRHSRFWTPDFPVSPRAWPVFYGWVVVAVATMGIVFSIPGQTMGFSVFTDILIEQLGLSRVQLSTAYCVGTVLSGLTLPALGRVFDRYGARKLIVGSSIATGLVLFYLSATHRLLVWLDGVFEFAPRVVIAFLLITLGFYLIRASAQGVLTMTCRNAIGKWFDYHRGTALAISGTVTAFTFSFAPKGLFVLIENFQWWGAWMILGTASILVMAVIGWLFLRDNPEECGLVMDGPVGSGRRREAHADSIAHRDYERHEALRTWAFWVFNLSFAFFAMFSTAFTFHVLSLGQEFGRPRAEIVNYFVPMAVLSVLTNLFCGWFSSRTRLKYLLMLMNLAALAGVIGTMTLNSRLGLAAYIAGNGMCGGCFSALTGIVWPRFYGRRWLGAIAGIGMSSMVIASGIGPLIFSLSLSWSGSYVPILWFCAILPALLLIGSAWADNPQRRFDD